MGYKYTISYAPTSRAQCRKCGRNIKVGSLRISRESDAIAHFGDHGIINHFHWKHGFDAMKRSYCNTNVILSTSNLKGYSSISPTDQRTVMKEILKFKKWRKSKCGKSVSPRKKSSKRNTRRTSRRTSRLRIRTHAHWHE